MSSMKTRTHSVRCTDSLWEAAKRRADHDGVQMNTVMSELLEGYGRGLVNLPKVIKTYTGVNVDQASTTAA